MKPVDYAIVNAIGSAPARKLIYHATMSFDSQELDVPIVRIQNIPDGIDFILGLTVLQHCSIKIDKKIMHIEWE